ncbi:unnamed protein product [Pylaiella littoralis]
MDAIREMPQTALLAGTALVACVFLALISAFRRSPKDAPPRVSMGMPLFGNIAAFLRSPLNMIRDCYDKYGAVFTVPMFGKNITFLVGPEAQAPFFKLNDETMSQNEVYGRYTKPVFGPDVVYAADPKKRNQQMQHMAYGLRTARLKSYVPMIEKETRLFLNSWGDSGEVDLLAALSRLTILTASRCLHGDDVRENLFEDVARLFHDLDEGMTPLSVFLPHAPVPAHFRRDKARKEMVSLLSSVIRARRAEQASGTSTVEKTDLLQVFVDMKYKDGSSNTDDQIVGLLIALLFAGQHTSSITSTWTTLLTTGDPKMLARLLEEQETVLKGPNTPLTWEHLGEMELLHDCMRETLRMYPPLVLLLRMAKKDFTVTSKGQSFTVPQGHYVGTSPHVAMRLPTVFKNPDKFDPDRFGADRQEHKQPFAYLGFGAGMHQCMGQQFAFVQVKTILSVLLREYNIEMVGALPPADFEAMVVGPKGKCTVRYTKKTP